MFRLARQEQFAIGALVLLLAAVIVGFTVRRRPEARGFPVEPGVNTGASGGVKDTEDPATPGAAAPGAAVTVHVTGAVESPGVYRLPLGARINDAVEKARPTDAADLSRLNLAARLEDGEKIVVPAYESSPRVMPREPAGADGAEEGAATVDLNSATQAELETLPGIGPARAKSIIDYRAEHPFRRVEDVMKVPGIGPGIFARIQDRIGVH
jgi:competence protein ComEA